MTSADDTESSAGRGLFKVHASPVGFNTLEYGFIAVVSGSTLQTVLKKLPRVEFWCGAKDRRTVSKGNVKWPLLSSDVCV